MLEGHVLARDWGFESPPAHQDKNHRPCVCDFCLLCVWKGLEGKSGGLPRELRKAIRVPKRIKYNFILVGCSVGFSMIYVIVDNIWLIL